jgi:hypothetical protein
MDALPAKLVARINGARRDLNKAAAVLACVAFAADHDADVDLRDAAQAACDLVVSAVNALDGVPLARDAGDG